MPQTVTHETRSIPLSALLPSPHNVRVRTEEDLAALRKTAEVRQLANSIEHAGLLQSLVVHQIDGDEKRFGVAGGGRRLAALTLLREEKKVRASHEIACTVVPEAEAMTASLLENVERASMHPAEEYVAFKRLIDSGKPVEDVAAIFGVSPLVVRRRLKLGNVAPALLDLYQADKLDLDAMMAYAVTDDHAAQLAAYESLSEYERANPRAIRNRLTESALPTTHKLVRFVTLKAIRKNGGEVQEDIFASDRSGFVTDGDLVRLMALNKLETAAAQLRDEEGHAWSEAKLDFDYSTRAEYDHAPMVRGKPTAEQKERLAALKSEYRKLEATLDSDDDDANDKASERMDAITEETESIEFSLQKPLKAVAKLCGVVVTVSNSGELEVHRGLVRPEDKKQLRAVLKAKQKAGRAGEDAATPSNDEPEGYSGALLNDLSCHYTAGLRVALGATPAVALRVIAAALYQSSGNSFRGGSSSPAEVRGARPSMDAPDIEESPAVKAWAEERKKWQTVFKESGDFLASVLAMDEAQVGDLIAFCAGEFVSAVGQRRSAGALRTAAAVGLDMRNFWTASPEAFLKRVPKGVILEAWREVSPEADLSSFASAKKSEVIAAAAPVLAEARWLPPCLRAATEAELAPAPEDDNYMDDDEEDNDDTDE